MEGERSNGKRGKGEGVDGKGEGGGNGGKEASGRPDPAGGGWMSEAAHRWTSAA